MRVLHITHLYPRLYDELYGIAMHNSVLSMINDDCKQVVVSPIAWAPIPLPYFSDKWRLYAQHEPLRVIDGVNVFYPKYLEFPKSILLNNSGNRMYWGIKQVVRELVERFQFDIVHAHIALPDGYAGMKISQDYNKPLVVTFQATDIDLTAKKNKKTLKVLESVFKYANKIISPSPRLSKSLKKVFNINSEVIGYGVNNEQIICKNNMLINQYRDRRILLSVSRLIDTKGIDLNLIAVKQLSSKYENILYLILGDGPARVKLEKLVSDLGLSKYVLFLGTKKQSKVFEYMASCEVFTLPSWQETFGLVYIEAMAQGKPVVAVKGQGVDGIIKSGENGMLTIMKDTKSLVQAIDFLLSNPSKAAEMGTKARKMILENYTWEKNADRTIKVYLEALNGC